MSSSAFSSLSWLGSVVFYKFMRYDELEVTAGRS